MASLLKELLHDALQRADDIVNSLGSIGRDNVTIVPDHDRKDESPNLNSVHCRKLGQNHSECRDRQHGCEAWKQPQESQVGSRRSQPWSDPAKTPGQRQTQRVRGLPRTADLDVFATSSRPEAFPATPQSRQPIPPSPRPATPSEISHTNLHLMTINNQRSSTGC